MRDLPSEHNEAQGHATQKTDPMGFVQTSSTGTAIQLEGVENVPDSHNHGLKLKRSKGKSNTSERARRGRGLYSTAMAASREPRSRCGNWTIASASIDGNMTDTTLP